MEPRDYFLWVGRGEYKPLSKVSDLELLQMLQKPGNWTVAEFEVLTAEAKARNLALPIKSESMPRKSSPSFIVLFSTLLVFCIFATVYILFISEIEGMI